MLKTYYAYLSIAGGYLIHLAGGQFNHWLVFVVAFGLISLGALELRRFSRWYYCAAAAAIVNSVLHIAGIWLAEGTLALLYLAAYCVLSVLLLRGYTVQRRSYGLGVGVENALLAALVVYGVGGGALLLYARPGAAYPDWFAAVVMVTNTCGALFRIGMIFDTFRQQKQTLQNEASQ